MPRNGKVTAFTVSELFRENQQSFHSKTKVKLFNYLCKKNVP